jgi:hypothetical protein
MDTTTAARKLMFHIFGALAQFNERVSAGLTAAAGFKTNGFRTSNKDSFERSISKRRGFRPTHKCFADSRN